jgi:hypothetical protein
MFQRLEERGVGNSSEACHAVRRSGWRFRVRAQHRDCQAAIRVPRIATSILPLQFPMKLVHSIYLLREPAKSG